MKTNEAGAATPSSAPYSADDRHAAQEYFQAARASRYRSTGEWPNPCGEQLAICAFEAGAHYARQKIAAGHDA